jgi:hypothetical protein
MSGYKKFQELALYQSIEDLAVWLIPHVGKWPRWLRPTMGQETLNCLMGVLRATTTAYAAPKNGKVSHLERASAELDGLRLLLRTSVALRLTSHEQFAHVSRLVGGVGERVGGWLRRARQVAGG